MRLIDADILKKEKCKLCIDKRCSDGYVCGDINLINNIPTACDIHRIAAQIAEKAERIDEFKSYDYGKLTLTTRWVISPAMAIGIVEGMGIEQQPHTQTHNEI